MPLPLRRLHHVAIIASDYRRSLQFYTDVLGLTLRAEHYRADRQSYKADLALDDTYVVELFSFPPPPPRPSHPEAAGLRPLAFEVDNIDDAVRHLETADAGIANFHLTFLFRLAVYLGIRPNRETYVEGRYFDLLEGIFTEEVPLHGRYLNADDSRVMARLTKMTFANMSLFAFSHTERSAILGHVLDFYRLHLPGFPELKSLEVLRALFE